MGWRIHFPPSRTPRPSASSLSAREVTAALVAFLQTVLGGDRLAATYVLLNMVSWWLLSSCVFRV